MSSRTIAQLRNDQANLAEELAATRQNESATVSTDNELGPARACWLGRVDEVVTEDEELGAHLKVVRQVFSGAPPTSSDRAESAAVAYLMPGESVSSYQTDDYVLLRRVDRVLLATSSG